VRSAFGAKADIRKCVGNVWPSYLKAAMSPTLRSILNGSFTMNAQHFVRKRRRRQG